VGRQKAIRVLLALGCALVTALPAAAQPDAAPQPPAQTEAAPPPAAAPPDPSADAIRAIVDAAQLDGLRWPRFPDYQHILKLLYESRADAPLWLADGRPTQAAREAIDVLHEADAKGLDSRDYDAELLGREADALATGGRAVPPDLARFDVALSVALLRNTSDLHIGKVNPKHLDFGYDIDPKKYDLAALVAQAVRDGQVHEVVAQAEPHFVQNQLLQQQLAHYRELAADPTLAPAALVAPVSPGMPLDEVPALGRWLQALGDLPAADAPPAEERVYEGALVEAVKRFQGRHGLRPDGVIDKNTATALLVPAADRVRQIELALERLRWIPSLETGRVVFVNVPAFELWAFDEISPAQPPAVRMDVVVGRALRTETPIFTGVMKTVVFAPYWNVPTSIARNEIAPKLRKNPGYLAAQGMELVSGGAVVAPSAGNIARLASGAVQVRQRPGPKNALGRVKFLFPNSNNVYFHDTPSQKPFGEARRDFSHGCIRLAQPAVLAEWVLRDQGFDAERVKQEMAGTREKAVGIDKPIPVVIYYATAFARRDGTISFYQDIYGHDAGLERALAKGYPYPP
jgi:murein L,D-transpeptidase YcbB/YkuD